jgi:hypothetical protein
MRDQAMLDPDRDPTKGTAIVSGRPISPSPKELI